MKNRLMLVLFIIIPLFAGIFGSFFTSPSIPTWYGGLIKPSFSPPNWLFGPVWTTLYILMGISGYLVYREGLKKREVKTALKIFWVQLGINSLWSVIFFGMRNPSLALIDIVILWLAIIATIAKFYKISRLASYLLIPYFLWVSFATVLNLSIVLLN